MLIHVIYRVSYAWDILAHTAAQYIMWMWSAMSVVLYILLLLHIKCIWPAMNAD